MEAHSTAAPINSVFFTRCIKTGFLVDEEIRLQNDETERTGAPLLQQGCLLSQPFLRKLVDTAAPGRSSGLALSAKAFPARASGVIVAFFCLLGQN
jgi:hypothetical protein